MGVLRLFPKADDGVLLRMICTYKSCCFKFSKLAKVRAHHPPAFAQLHRLNIRSLRMLRSKILLALRACVNLKNSACPAGLCRPQNVCLNWPTSAIIRRWRMMSPTAVPIIRRLKCSLLKVAMSHPAVHAHGVELAEDRCQMAQQALKQLHDLLPPPDAQALASSGVVIFFLLNTFPLLLFLNENDKQKSKNNE